MLAQQHFVKRGSYWLIRPAMMNKNISYVITVINILQIIRCSCSRVDGNKKTCELCGLKFNRLDNLTEHKKSVHEKRSFSCSACGISYRWKSSLSRHNKNKHSK